MDICCPVFSQIGFGMLVSIIAGIVVVSNKVGLGSIIYSSYLIVFAIIYIISDFEVVAGFFISGH